MTSPMQQTAFAMPQSLQIPLIKPSMQHSSFEGNHRPKRSRSLSSLSSASSSSLPPRSFSLPFKKRRFFLMEEEGAAAAASSVVTVTTPPSIDKPALSLSPIPTQEDQPNESSSGKTNLVTPRSSKSLSLSAVCITPILSPRIQSIGIDCESSSSLQGRSSKRLASKASATTNEKPKRLYHPKLESPLPNGCHGKTSRTHSYCRRGPNYNGSNFCRLHYFDPRYQSLIKEHERSHGGTSKQPPQDKTMSEDIQKRPKDKLYRGLEEDSEVRCQAISTRGKRCCYAAAVNQLYCHRHASQTPHEESRQLLPPIATSAAVVIVPKDDSGQTLNLLSTKEWEGKKVRIEKGPHRSKLATVVKWRNGWVTLRLDSEQEEVLHNRRSYELVLV